MQSGKLQERKKGIEVFLSKKFKDYAFWVWSSTDVEKNPTEKYWSVKAGLSWVHWSQQYFHQKSLLRSQDECLVKGNRKEAQYACLLPEQTDKSRCCKAGREHFLSNLLVYVSAVTVS